MFHVVSPSLHLSQALQSNLKYSLLPRRLIIGKRLAQCLHPALPSGVHLKALETYEVIFKIIGTKWLARDLFIYRWVQINTDGVKDGVVLSVYPRSRGKLYIWPTVVGFFLVIVWMKWSLLCLVGCMYLSDLCGSAVPFIEKKKTVCVCAAQDCSPCSAMPPCLWKWQCWPYMSATSCPCRKLCCPACRPSSWACCLAWRRAWRSTTGTCRGLRDQLQGLTIR